MEGFFSPTVTLTWQNGRQLATYGSGSKLVTYGYNGDGLRISKSGARNTEYIIVGGTYVGERTTINGTEYLIAYLYGDNGIVGINVNGTNYYFVKNLQGDITGIIDSAGNVVARYTYDAYGAPIDITDGDGNVISPNNHTHIANLNPFRYRGYTYDQETGFYYLTTRYYDPYVGRFLNADAYVTTGQGFDGNNMFAYCGNNPASRVEVGGMAWDPLYNFLHDTNDYLLSIGFDTAAIGAFFLMMEDNNNDGIYHATFNCWQQYAGYNDYYDRVFDLATSMEEDSFIFFTLGGGYTIWVWKGDYINLGAGAEIGIYRGFWGHRTVDKDLAMRMEMTVKYNGKIIINYAPSEKQWWLTAFNSNIQRVDAKDLTVKYRLYFDDRSMYYGLKIAAAFGNYKGWTFYDSGMVAELIF